MIDLHFGVNYASCLDPVSRFCGEFVWATQPQTERTAACCEVSRNSSPLVSLAVTV